MHLKNKKKIALVLSGGGIKAAAYHIGVCTALHGRGFQFLGGYKRNKIIQEYDPSKTVSLYVGSSAGAFVASILASGHSIESLVHAFEVGLKQRNFSDFDSRQRIKPISYRDLFSINTSNISKTLLMAIPSLLKSKQAFSGGGIEAFLKRHFKINGFFSAAGIEKYLRTEIFLENDFTRLLPELFIVTSQLNHSRKVIFGPFAENIKLKTTHHANFAPISEAVAASASLPPMFSPFGIKNEKGKQLYYFDGGIRDTLSTHVATDNGADLVICSYSVQPYHYNPEFGSLEEHGIPMIINQALYQVIEQKIQAHIEHEAMIKGLYEFIDGYFKQQKITDEHRTKILDIFTQKAHFNPHVDYMYIHPTPQDHEMFFGDHFSLNSKVLQRIAKVGFKSAINVLRQYDL